MPGGLLVTVPLPVPSLPTDKGCCTGSSAKLAVAVRAALMVTAHRPVPVHAPLHPTKVDPTAGTAVSVTVVSAG
jgi:hypothetical protein